MNWCRSGPDACPTLQGIHAGTIKAYKRDGVEFEFYLCDPEIDGTVGP